MLNKIFIWLLEIYRLLISPIFPPSCRYYPTCSEYAIHSLRKHPLPKALVLIVWRILRCNPFCRGGYDPVK